MVLRRKGWLYLDTGIVVGLFPEQGAYVGKVVMVGVKRCVITRVSRLRNAVKVREAQLPYDTDHVPLMFQHESAGPIL